MEDPSELVHDMDFMDSEPSVKEQSEVGDIPLGLCKK